MPIEIRELSIKINLNEGGAANNTPAQKGSNNEANQQAIVEAVIEKVLEILKEKTER